MDYKEIEKISIGIVVNYYNNKRRLRKPGTDRLTEKDVYVVWCCKTLQNNKLLLSTTKPDGFYYEVTYNGDKKEVYFDAYVKYENMKFDVSLLKGVNK